MRVLLVEDDPMIGQAMAQGLLDAAHAVDWVHAGEQGVAALRAAEYDMLLLDLGLLRDRRNRGVARAARHQ